MGVSGSGTHLVVSILNTQDCDIKGPSSKIEDDNESTFDLLRFKLKCKACCSRLINNSNDIETCYCSGRFGGLPLIVIKICRNCDHCVFNFLLKVYLCLIFQLCQNHRRYLLWLIGFLLFSLFHLNHCSISSIFDDFERPEYHIFLDLLVWKLFANKTLDIEDSVNMVYRHLKFSSISYCLSKFIEAYNRRSEVVSLWVENNFYAVILIHSDTRIRGAKVDSYGFILLFFLHLKQRNILLFDILY